MAPINCPQCGKEISDKASFCPQCGFELTNANSEKNEDDNLKVLVCEECGKEISEDEKYCPNCGCPVTKKDSAPTDEKILPQQVEITKINIPIFKKKAFWISIVSVFVIIVGSVLGIKMYQDKQIEKYYSNLQLINFTMLNGASQAESAGGLIHDVWYNTIYDKYDSTTYKYTNGETDFNDSLKNLFSDKDFSEKISSIKTNQETVDSLMKDLKNPPKKYEDAYRDLRSFYDSYVEFTNLVINPKGSLQSFTSNFNDADTKTVNGYKTMQLYLDE